MAEGNLHEILILKILNFSIFHQAICWFVDDICWCCHVTLRGNKEKVKYQSKEN